MNIRHTKPVRSRMTLLATTLVGAVLLTGCNGDMGQVEGTIQMDGAPLADAVIEFYPEDGGRAASGRTDADGQYRLQYSRGKTGAMIGMHKVVIRTGEEGGGGDYGPGKKETVPMKYNTNTTLTAEVKPGSNTIDFMDLDSEGKVFELPRGY